MEITLEMVEQLRQHAPVSYAQAKQALEHTGGNLLDAVIYLEETGAIPRAEECYTSTRPQGQSQTPPRPAIPPAEEEQQRQPRGLRHLLRRARVWLIDNEFEIWRREQPITSLPLLILILLLIFAYAVVIPLLVVGLFLGFRYRFSGPDLERESINSVMGSVADTAADVGRQVMDEISRRSGWSESKVTSALFQLRRKLRQHLEKEGIEV